MQKRRHPVLQYVPWLLLGLCLAACSNIPNPLAPATATPTVTLTPSPTLTPAPTATATPTATPTPLPTPNPVEIADLTNAGLTRVQTIANETLLSNGARVLCLRAEDSDGDGAPEWLALTHQEGPPARLSAFILDGEQSFWLEPATAKVGVPDVGLGQFATCEVEIRDVNVDDIPEVAVFGHADKNETILHLFAWDGTHYQRLGRFSGDAGVRFVDADGDLEMEIWEGYRDRGAPALAWNVIYTWEEQTYGWTTDRYDWYSRERPHSYPTHKAQYAVTAFYLALNDRDMPGAYALLTPQEGREYTDWVAGFATTIRVSVGGVHPVDGTVTDTSTRIAAMVISWDNEGGMIVGRRWDVEWDTILTAEGWRLAATSAEKLEEWPVTYWP